jgi:hypothetical protein
MKLNIVVLVFHLLSALTIGSITLATIQPKYSAVFLTATISILHYEQAIHRHYIFTLGLLENGATVFAEIHLGKIELEKT